MSSHHTSLLKLIDLAIGFPSPLSVNLHLLHKILYILAVRNKSPEGDEIEISHLSENVAQALMASGERSGSQTRLMVQRIRNRSSEEQRLKITGSRIVVPWEEQQLAGNGSLKIESRLSAMSSVVSNLEERMQEISQKPNDVLEAEIQELGKRIENLETLIEQQTAKISIKDDAQLEPGDEKNELTNRCGIEQMSNAIAALQDQINELHAMVEQNIIITPTAEGELLDMQDEQASNGVSEVVDPVEDASEAKMRSSEAKKTGRPPIKATTNLAEVLREIQKQQTQFDDSLKAFANQLDICSGENQPNSAQCEQTVVVDQLTEQLGKIEHTFAAKIEQLENSINRLFQEKANDLDIDSRVRQSIRLSNASLAGVPSSGQIQQLQQLIDERTEALSDQLRANQVEVNGLREGMEAKASVDYLLSVTSAINEQVKQLHHEWQTARRMARANEERAAGTKCKAVQNVLCISCNREVAMERCDEVVPKPLGLGAGRLLKPSLHRQLHEIRKNLDYNVGTGNMARNMDTFEKVYRSLVDKKIKRMK
ncbi:myosin-2 heavy chain, non muscle-like [Toxorhynchites rutilus septentrionalis]|uniref:myosin-2 heavy chain, non muscle-like n=1 Tax=Toxorhynchites rutilus septentrionalis TaxID=329112 RepID=UPI00247883F3|nr:myosin-2 heavy chain, non muscle-like [Toxorhynchites rutilus septentrionalis]